MNALTQSLTVFEQRLLLVNQWFALLDDTRLRMSCPNTYHEALLRQADEMDRQGLVAWTEWRDLRRLADRAWLRAVAGADYH